MPGGFRIQSVAIEGFKGFTARQVIDLDGRHAFLLGHNGNGKSSIVEAIRWGLFGSTGRPNEVVANRGYSVACRVELDLLREGRRWSLRRTLQRGVRGGSDPVLRDENGQVHPVGEIMPQLESADAGEGMHIIFAPQGTAFRRQPEDLLPFERTVFRYLGLTSPRAFLDQLRDFVREQEGVENDLGQQITEAASVIDKRISELDSERGIIVGASPWGGTRVPTLADSENKIRSLIAEITGRQPDDSLSRASLDALIEDAEDALKAKRYQDQGSLRDEVRYNEERLSSLGELQAAYEGIRERQARSQAVKSRLDEVLSGMSMDELRGHIAQVQAEKDARDLRRKIVDEVVSLVSRDDNDIAVCPVCETKHNREKLTARLARISAELPEGDATLSQLQRRLSQAEELTGQTQHIAGELNRLAEAARDAYGCISEEDYEALPEPISVPQIEAVKARVIERKTSLEAQIRDQNGWFSDITLKLANLKQEERLHRINKELSERRRSSQRLVRVKEAHGDLISFGESVRAISRAVETHIDERLVAGIPVVSDNLSKAFAALACHPWYDRLVIAKNVLTRLQLRAASSQDPLASEEPIGVLNGQAERAAELAPYFAFSQNEDVPTEVYLVMLDDPTRAFDEAHTRVLVQRLAELGQNVQLIVASQETTRFRELLPENFAPASYVIVEPTQWSRASGPQLLIDRE